MRNFALFAAAAAFALQAVPAQAELTRAEKTMISTVDAEQERTVDLLAKLVNQNSGTLNNDGVRKVGDMMRAELEPLGFTVQWIDMADAKRAGHIVATHKGSKNGKRLLLIAHLDTVFEPTSPFQTWERKGDSGIGPGAGDDKGGMAVIVAALRAMKAAGTLKNANIEVVLTGDEEDAGSPITISRRDLLAAAARSDIALDFEGLSTEDGKDMGVVARRGSLSWQVDVAAKSGHSSGVFSDYSGYGAIYEAARIIDQFRQQLRDDKLTYSVGLIVGGQGVDLGNGGTSVSATGKTNIIPATAVIRGDLRALTEEQVDRTQTKMKAIVANSLPGTTATIKFDEEPYPPMAPTAGNRALLTALNGVNADMGLGQQEELDPLKRGAGDISFVARQVDGLVGLGPASDGDHAPGETVDIPSISKQAKRAAILMSRLAAENR